MHIRRFVLLVLAVACLVPAFLFGTTDVFVGDRNCGAALWPKDTAKVAEESGDRLEDDFNAEVLRKQCGRSILRQRAAMVASLAVGVVLLVLALRSKPPTQRFPGDPIV